MEAYKFISNYSTVNPIVFIRDFEISSISEGSEETENEFVTTTYTSISGFNNSTEPRDGVPPEYREMSPDSRNCVIAYIFLFIIAATGNFSVFFSVLQQLRRTKSRISVFILHLSLADLLVTFGVIPLEVIWRVTIGWYGGNGLCKFCKFFSAFGLYLSSFVLICISLDRYFVIMHPLRVADAKQRGRLMLFVAWIMAAVCSLPQVFIFHVETHPIYQSFPQCVSLGFFGSPHEELIYNVFSVVFMYFIPLITVIFTYVMIICKITRKSRQHRESGKPGESNDGTATSGRAGSCKGGGRIQLRRSDASNHMERARNRTLKLTIVIVSVFILCSTPYVVMTLWYMLDRKSAEKVDPRIQDALFIMVVSNSCFNPLVYGTYTRECRQSMTSCCGISRTRTQSRNHHYQRTRRQVNGGGMGCGGGGGGGGGARRDAGNTCLNGNTSNITSRRPSQFKKFNHELNINENHHNQRHGSIPRQYPNYFNNNTNSSLPTSIVPFTECGSSAPSPSPILNTGSSQSTGSLCFFRSDSRPSSFKRAGSPRGGGGGVYPPPRSASLNQGYFGTNIEGRQSPGMIQEESENSHSCYLGQNEEKNYEQNLEQPLLTSCSQNGNNSSNTIQKFNTTTEESHNSIDNYSIQHFSPVVVHCKISHTTSTPSHIATECVPAA